jgi:phage FluMu protein Com
MKPKITPSLALNEQRIECGECGGLIAKIKNGELEIQCRNCRKHRSKGLNYLNIRTLLDLIKKKGG